MNGWFCMERTAAIHNQGTNYTTQKNTFNPHCGIPFSWLRFAALVLDGVVVFCSLFRCICEWVWKSILAVEINAEMGGRAEVSDGDVGPTFVFSFIHARWAHSHQWFEVWRPVDHRVPFFLSANVAHFMCQDDLTAGQRVESTTFTSSSSYKHT